VEGSRSDRKASNYLIKKDIQLRGILYNVIFLLLVALITLVAALAPMWQKMLHSHDIDVQFYAAGMLLHFLKRWTPVMAAVFVIFILHQLILSHQVCGPLVNFMHTIRAAAKGSLARKIYLRKGDYLGDEGHEINQMIDGLTDLLSATRSEGERLYALFENLEPSNVAEAELEETLRLAQEKVATCEKAMSKFNLATSRIDQAAAK
jgi:methyl-accepting chemotaxis protein